MGYYFRNYINKQFKDEKKSGSVKVFYIIQFLFTGQNFTKSTQNLQNLGQVQKLLNVFCFRAALFLNSDSDPFLQDT